MAQPPESPVFAGGGGGTQCPLGSQAFGGAQSLLVAQLVLQVAPSQL
jgi:hypothetical protein